MFSIIISAVLLNIYVPFMQKCLLWQLQILNLYLSISYLLLFLVVWLWLMPTGIQPQNKEFKWRHTFWSTTLPTKTHGNMRMRMREFCIIHIAWVSLHSFHLNSLFLAIWPVSRMMHLFDLTSKVVGVSSKIVQGSRWFILLFKIYSIITHYFLYLSIAPD